jgi:hypothetical protein
VSKRKTEVRDQRSEQYVSIKCECGMSCGAYLSHYDVLKHDRCGRYYWALQPARSGPLVLFAWPRYNHATGRID